MRFSCLGASSLIRAQEISISSEKILSFLIFKMTQRCASVHILPTPFTFEYAVSKLCPTPTTHIIVSPDGQDWIGRDIDLIHVSSFEELVSLPFKWSVIIDLCDDGMWSACASSLRDALNDKLCHQDAVLYTNFVQYFNVWAPLLTARGKLKAPATMTTPYQCPVGKIYKIKLN